MRTEEEKDFLEIVDLREVFFYAENLQCKAVVSIHWDV